ncbi:uncharacterized protein LOC110255765 [Sus scrofa]|uniref:uncharacterized protein LOC110255765 n=1 Tax=Sus scrofa TaxID=9823 RepID=UPI000A2AF677|nr:uncharacterized protein LOC110255765 [Sus scrofa]
MQRRESPSRHRAAGPAPQGPGPPARGPSAWPVLGERESETRRRQGRGSLAAGRARHLWGLWSMPVWRTVGGRSCSSPGGTFRAPAPGRQPELEQALAGLAAALSQTQEPPTGASRQASGQPAEPPLSACHQDPQLASDAPPQPRPPPSQGKHHSTSPLQHPGPGQQSRGDVKGGDPQHPGLAQRHRAFPELQRKTRQVEDSLDALNEEFFQLTAQALALQKEEDKPGQLLPVEDRQDLAEAGESLGPWALRSDQALALEARRACLARRADDLEWELALLLQVAAGRWPSVARR